MPVYNGKPYLGPAIESILAQSFSDFELLIIDDGSTDGSRDLSRSFLDPRVRCLDNPRNIGLTPTLNRGLQEARGEFVARQDQDDLSMPDRLERQMTYMSQHPQTVLLGSNLLRVETDGNVLGDGFIPGSSALIQWILIFQNCLAHSTVLMQRAAVEGAGGYDPSFHWAQDYALYSQLMRRNEKIACLSDILLYLRVHSQSASRLIDLEQKREPARVSCANFQYFLPTFSAESIGSLSAILRGERPPSSTSEAEQAIDMLTMLHAAFETAVCPSAEDRKMIRRDAAKRLARLAIVWRRTVPPAASKASRLSLQWDKSGRALLWAFCRDLFLRVHVLSCLTRIRGILRTRKVKVSLGQADENYH